MVRRNFIRFAACIAMAMYQLVLGAQSPEEPSTYTVSVKRLSGQGAITTTYRLGPQVVVDYAEDPGAVENSTLGTHKRTLLNLETKLSLTWDRVDISVPCVRSNFTDEDRQRATTCRIPLWAAPLWRRKTLNNSGLRQFKEFQP